MSGWRGLPRRRCGTPSSRQPGWPAPATRCYLRRPRPPWTSSVTTRTAAGRSPRPWRRSGEPAMTTSTRPRSTGADRRPPVSPNRSRPAPRRLRGPAWLDGPMTSCHLVLGAAGLLLTIGLVMVFSASSIKAALAHEPVWAPGVQQLVWAAIGSVALLLALRLPVGFLRRWAGPAMLVALAMLLLV